MDRFLLPNSRFYDLYATIVKRLNSVHQLDVAVPETYQSYYEPARDAGDRSDTVGIHEQLLEETGFDSYLLHVHGDRGLIAARRKL